MELENLLEAVAFEGIVPGSYSGEHASLMPFLEDLLKGCARRIYTEEDIIKEGRLDYLTKLTKTGKADISQTPIPRWDLLDLHKYHSPGIQYSRGCPKDCEFCDVTKLFGREPRTKTPQQMILELDAVYNAGHRGNVMIVDDNKDIIQTLLI